MPGQFRQQSLTAKDAEGNLTTYFTTPQGEIVGTPAAKDAQPSPAGTEISGQVYRSQADSDRNKRPTLPGTIGVNENGNATMERDGGKAFLGSNANFVVEHATPEQVAAFKARQAAASVTQTPHIVGHEAHDGPTVPAPGQGVARRPGVERQ